MSFCTNCGAPRTTGGSFCTTCGAAQNPVASPPAAPVGIPPSAPTFQAVSAPGALPPVAVKSGKGLRNFVIVAVVFLLLVIGLGIAGAIYAVRVAKEKAESVLKKVAPSVASVVATPANGAEPSAAPAADAPLPPAAPSTFAPWQPSTSAASSAGAPAPLRAGMLVVTAIADERGDYESMKQIQTVDQKGVTLTYRSEKPKQGNETSSQQTLVSRTVLTQDLATAHDYAEIFGSTDPESFPGTTAISASREVLAELQQKGASQFSFRPDGIKGAIGNLVGMFSQMAGQDAKDAGGLQLDKLSKEQCKLQREGNGFFAFPVLLNDQPTTLPALRAACMTDDGPAEFYILNQPEYPLMLSWKLGSGSQLQVIKISYPPAPAARKDEVRPAPPSAIEEQLKEKKKVEIYGIYFDFASDHLKPESTPVLEEIAGVLTSNPEWKLTVSGHTDNVGGDPYNLDLSQRRAAAVKLALVTRYHVAPERLTTDGFGASRPVATNDTLAGRALNRRVELTRE